ncbi:uncharacterized protein [Periplaneta americana]|uniref:uncharacterized protein n=1 Tax=Periplaneta americana TaxID=6978 RepID=UPI0037E8E067
MDAIKTEPEVDPLSTHTNDVIEEKKPLTEGMTLLDFDTTWIKKECVDQSYDATSEIKFEETGMSLNPSPIKSEAEIGFLQTGSGVHELKSDSTDAKIVSGLRTQFDPDENQYSSNAAVIGDISVVFENVGEASDCNLITLADDHSLNMTRGSSNPEVTRNDVLTSSHRPTPKRKNFFHCMSESIVDRKKAKHDIAVEIKRMELEFKCKQYQRKCEILELEKQIALKTLKAQSYEREIKDLDNKMKLKQNEMI